MMLVRLIVGAGLFVAGYYLGREIGRHEHLQREIEDGRNAGRFREILDNSRPGDTPGGEEGA